MSKDIEALAETAIPRPDVSRVAPFWAAARDRRLAFPRCEACGTFNWYPAPECGTCGGGSFRWDQASAPPEVFSWTVAARPLEPRLAPLVPFATVILEFEDAPGVRLISRLVDTSPDRLEVGQRGRMTFLDLGYPAVETGIIAPLFTLDDPSDRP